MTTLDDISPPEPRSLAYGVLFPSALAEMHGATDRPFVMFGHDALDASAFFSQASTLNCLAVRTVELLELALADIDPVGIYALSSPERPGEAGDAIRRFRELVPGRRACVYGAWTHDLQVAAGHAVDATADGLLPMNCDAQEMFTYLFRIFEGVENDYPVPTDPGEILQGLKLAFPNSPFWNEADEGSVATF